MLTDIKFPFSELFKDRQDGEPHVPQFLPSLVPKERWEERTKSVKLSSDLNMCTEAHIPTHPHIVQTNDNKQNYLFLFISLFLLGFFILFGLVFGF